MRPLVACAAAASLALAVLTVPAAQADPAMPAYTQVASVYTDPSGATTAAGGAVTSFDADDSGTTVAFTTSNASAYSSTEDEVWLRTPDALTRLDDRSAAGTGFRTADAAVSPNGRYVVFASTAAGVTPGSNPAASRWVVYRYDTALGSLTAVSPNPTSPAGDAVGPSVADTGAVAFRWRAVGASGWTAKMRAADGTTTTVALAGDGSTWPGDVTAVSIACTSGCLVAFAAHGDDPADDIQDSNASTDVLLRDTGAGTTRYVSAAGQVAQSGTITAQALSSSGNAVAFTSSARLTPDDTDDLFDVYVRNLDDGALIGASTAITADTGMHSGRMAGPTVAFVGASAAVRYLDGRTDIPSADTERAWLWTSGRTLRTSFAGDGGPLDGPVSAADASASGGASLWASTATNAAPLDFGSLGQVYTTAVPGALSSATRSLEQLTVYSSDAPTLLTVSGPGVTPGMSIEPGALPVTGTASTLQAAVDGTGEASCAISATAAADTTGAISLVNLFGDTVALATTVRPAYPTMLQLSSTRTADGTLRIVATLVSQGSGIADQVLTLQVRDFGGLWRNLTPATTTAEGTATWELAQVSPLQAQASFAGDRTSAVGRLPATSGILDVPLQASLAGAQVSLIGDASPTATSVAVSARITAAVTPATAPVSLQALTSGTWTDLASAQPAADGTISLEAVLPIRATAVRLATAGGNGWQGATSTEFPLRGTRLTAAATWAGGTNPLRVTVTHASASDGAAVAGSTLHLWTARTAGTWQRADDAVTDAAGQATWTLPALTSATQVRVGYTGVDDGVTAWMPTLANVTVAYPTALGTPQASVSGKAVSLSAFAAGDLAPVELQARTSSGWLTIGSGQVTGGRAAVTGTLPAQATALRLAVSGSASWIAATSPEVPVLTPAITLSRVNAAGSAVTIKATVTAGGQPVPVDRVRLWLQSTSGWLEQPAASAGVWGLPASSAPQILRATFDGGQLPGGELLTPAADADFTVTAPIVVHRVRVTTDQRQVIATVDVTPADAAAELQLQIRGTWAPAMTGTVRDGTVTLTSTMPRWTTAARLVISADGGWQAATTDAAPISAPLAMRWTVQKRTQGVVRASIAGSPVTRGADAVLQVKRKGRWIPVIRARTSAKGVAAFTYRAGPGTVTLRGCLQADGWQVSCTTSWTSAR